MWCIFVKDQLLLLRQSNGCWALPQGDEPPLPLPGKTQPMEVEPLQDGTPVRAVNLDELTAPRGLTPQQYTWMPLRQTFYHLTTEHYLKAGKCRELLYWDTQTQFCGRCGAPMQLHTAISKRCTHCNNEVWPQLSTAIIVLIHRGEEVLLVHARSFQSDFYGLVAGFVETGETLEQAVHREVMEETGLTIRNLTYFGSQPWPYPCGLMVGFMAEYAGGELRLQESELSAGQWFRHDALPRVPSRLSIARKLLDAWMEQWGESITQN